MASPSASPLAAGHKLDRYELLCPIGEGGMASVWVARLTRKHGFEKLVAIKTILPKFAEDETFQKMFLDEARIASRIEHANVVHIHDLGEENHVLYIVMDWLDGEALTRLRKAIVKAGHTFPLGVALRIMADVCAGLHAAHELRNNDGTSLGVVHRDVSPQNVLITVEGVSKLIDFGVAKAAHRLVDETSAGFVKGKVQYMAPEQALGKAVDRRADVWAAGAVLYHLLAQRPPFEADNQLAMLHQLTRGSPPPALPASIPPAVTEIVRRALTHDLTQRFQTASEMRSAIERTGLAATTEDVATCLRTYLGARAQARRDALAAALRAANARAEEEDQRRASMSDASGPRASAPNLADVKETQRLDPSFRPAFVPPHAPGVTAPGAMPPQQAQQAWRAPPGAHVTPARSFPIPTSPDRASRSDGVPSAPGHTGPGAFAPPSPSSPDLLSVAGPLPFDQADAVTTPSLASAGHEPATAGSLGSASISAPIATHRPGFRRGVVLGFAAVLSVLAIAAVLVGLNFERLRTSVAGTPTFSPTFSPLPPSATTSAFMPNATATVESAPSPTLDPRTSPTGTASATLPATSASVFTSQSAVPAPKPAEPTTKANPTDGRL